ncbi:MAG TPA: hypothetical protein VGJ09_00185 [Bryobacteraceae bacterium]
MPSLKGRSIWMAVAALWLVAVSTIFTTVSLVMVGTPVARLALIAVIVAVIAYLAIGVGTIRALRRSPGAIPPRTPEHRLMLRRYAYVVIAEVAAIMVANIVCAVMRRVELIVPLDLLIVGIHFLPLASIFRMPRYYTMGALFCIVCLGTVMLIPARVQVGAAASWFVIPTFGCTAVAWATAAFNLREAREYLRS